jgi:hypothetical protein
LQQFPVSRDGGIGQPGWLVKVGRKSRQACRGTVADRQGNDFAPFELGPGRFQIAFNSAESEKWSAESRKCEDVSRQTPVLEKSDKFSFPFFTKNDPTRPRNCEDVPGQSSIFVFCFYLFGEK